MFVEVKLRKKKGIKANVIKSVILYFFIVAASSRKTLITKIFVQKWG